MGEQWCRHFSTCVMQNAVGIFAAGGLGGVLYLQKKEQQKLEAEKQASMALQQSQIDGLMSQVRHVLRPDLPLFQLYRWCAKHT